MKFEFVDEIPRKLDRDTVYVSMVFAVVAHSCFCGCGQEVITPLSPAEWKLTFDGETVSLYPSIGNWNLDCKSHYWIRNNTVIWAEGWSDARIEAGRRREQRAREQYCRSRRDDIVEVEIPKKNCGQPSGPWSRIKNWLNRFPNRM